MIFDFGTLSSSDIRDLAKSWGWAQDTDALSHGLYVLNNPRFERRQLVFPVNSTAPDYAESVRIVLGKLSELHQDPLFSIVARINELSDDTVSFRVLNSRNEDNFIPLPYAVSALNGAKEMFLSAACTVLTPQPHHRRLSRTEAQQLLDRTRFRQTERGSFIIKVSTPVRALDFPTHLYEGQTTFTRQTTLAINQGVSKLISSIERDTLPQLLDEIRRTPGQEISSNLCGAIIDFQEEHDDYDLQIDFGWSPAVPNPSGMEIPRSIRIQKEYFSRIDDVRRELRATVEQDIEEVFMATVEHLAGDVGIDGRRSGEVILYLYRQSETIRARVNIDSDRYEVADRSHMTPNSYLRVKGRLRPGNQPRTLTDVSTFEFIGPDGQQTRPN